MVLNSHEYRKIEITSALNSLILVFRQMFLSLQMGRIFDIVAVVCAARDKISALDHSSMIMEPRYLNWPTISSSCPLTLILVGICLSLFVISFVIFTFISMSNLEDVLSRFFTKVTSSSSLPAKSINVVCKAEVGDVTPSNADCPTVVFQGFAQDAL